MTTQEYFGVPIIIGSLYKLVEDGGWFLEGEIIKLIDFDESLNFGVFRQKGCKDLYYESMEYLELISENEVECYDNTRTEK